MGPGTVVTAPAIARFDGEPVSQPIGPSAAAFFSLAVIGRRFLVGLASDAVSRTGVGHSRRPPRRGAPLLSIVYFAVLLRRNPVR